jgi:mannose-6-phosphate isomerase-like protein (cupin superfamily)
MPTTAEIPAGQPIELTTEVVGLERPSGRAVLVPQQGGPPHRIDGYTVGAPVLIGDAPHAGEMHPDGDELLFLVSGRVQVTLELDDGTLQIEVGPGQAVVVPRGVWHLVHLLEPGQLVHITPGPNGDHRPLPAC